MPVLEYDSPHVHKLGLSAAYIIFLLDVDLTAREIYGDGTGELDIDSLWGSYMPARNVDWIEGQRTHFPPWIQRSLQFFPGSCLWDLALLPHVVSQRISDKVPLFANTNTCTESERYYYDLLHV